MRQSPSLTINVQIKGSRCSLGMFGAGSLKNLSRNSSQSCSFVFDLGTPKSNRATTAWWRVLPRVYHPTCIKLIFFGRKALVIEFAYRRCTSCLGYYWPWPCPCCDFFCYYFFFLARFFLLRSLALILLSNWFVNRRETQRFLNLTSFDENILILQEAIRWLDYWLVTSQTFRIQFAMSGHTFTHWQHSISSNPGGQETLAKNSEGAKAKALLSNGKDSACNLVMAAGLVGALPSIGCHMSSTLLKVPGISRKFSYFQTTSTSKFCCLQFRLWGLIWSVSRDGFETYPWINPSPKSKKKSAADAMAISTSKISCSQMQLQLWIFGRKKRNPQDSEHHIPDHQIQQHDKKNAQPLRGSMILEASAKTWDSFRPASQPIRPVVGESWPLFIAGTGQSALWEFTWIAILSEMVCTRSGLTHVAVFYGMPFLWYGTTHHPNMDTETPPE